MPLAMLLTVVGLALSVVLATVVMAEQRNTRRDLGRTSALAAAHSGVDVAISSIRLAVRGDASGDPRALPCTTTPLTGSVSTGGSAYSVRVYYTMTAPTPGTVPTSVWACGTSAAGMPAYAYIESTGVSGGISRTLTATYALTTVVSNEKVPGGIIRAFGNAGTPDYCFAAATTTPASTQLQIRLCDVNDARQQFAYSAGLTLYLTALKSPSGQQLCLDAGAMNVNDPVTFQPCTAQPVARQVWGSDDSTAFYVMPTTSTRRCMESSAEYADATVKLAAMKSTAYCTNLDDWSETQTFLTASSTGGGRAGPQTQQLVNSAQFGRCIDITADDVNSTYLVSFPCKQQITGGVLWNQRWTEPEIPAGEDSAVGPIYTVQGGTTDAYCLRSPGTTVRGSYYPTVTRCDPNGVLPADQKWTLYGDTGNKLTAYRIESTYGAPSGSAYCLGISDPAVSNPDLWDDGFNLRVSKLILQPCTNSDMQKWNAFTTTTKGSLGDFTER